MRARPLHRVAIHPLHDFARKLLHDLGLQLSVLPLIADSRADCTSGISGRAVARRRSNGRAASYLLAVIGQGQSAMHELATWPHDGQWTWVEKPRRFSSASPAAFAERVLHCLFRASDNAWKMPPVFGSWRNRQCAPAAAGDRVRRLGSVSSVYSCPLGRVMPAFRATAWAEPKMIGMFSSFARMTATGRGHGNGASIPV